MIDVGNFITHNIIDSCSIQNVLSSVLLYQSAQYARCCFYCTSFVRYECLFKSAKHNLDSLLIIRDRLRGAQKKGDFAVYNIDIEDLQEVDALYNKMKLSKGELSSMIFAKKTNQAFLTDDQNARKLAASYIGQSHVQTTPQLVGWLIFINILTDADKDTILRQHSEMNGTLGKYIHEAYMMALQLRLAKAPGQPESTSPITVLSQ